MNKFIGATLFIVLCVLISSSCKKHIFGNKERATLADSINKYMTDIISHAQKLETSKYMPWLSNDTSSQYFLNTGYYSYDQMGSVIKEAYSKMSAEKFMLTKSRTTVLGPDAVLWTGYGKGWCSDIRGETFVQMLTETWVWKKTGKQWKVIHYHESAKSLPSTAAVIRIEKSLTEFAKLLKMKDLVPGEMVPYLSDYLDNMPDAKGIIFAFKPYPGEKDSIRNAQYVYRKNCQLVPVNIPPSYNYTKADWFANSCRLNNFYWTEAYLDEGGSDTWVITCGLPVFDKNEAFKGVIAADLEINQ